MSDCRIILDLFLGNDFTDDDRLIVEAPMNVHGYGYSQFDKNYMHALIRYNRALQQRNVLLKNEKTSTSSLLEIWEEQITDEGMYIFERRKPLSTNLFLFSILL